MKRYYYEATFGDGENDIVHFSVVATNISDARKKASYILKLKGMNNHSTLMKLEFAQEHNACNNKKQRELK